jgi:hypothetical protein
MNRVELAGQPLEDRGVDGRPQPFDGHPATVPKAVDVITPADVSQATELDPTLGTVVIQPVTVP